MKFLRLFLSLFLFSPWFVQYAWGADSPRLVEIYCGEVLRQGTPEWGTLVERLESASPYRDSSLLESPDFAACVSDHADLFSTGEFLRGGLEILRQASLGQTGAQAEGGVRVAVAAENIELPLVGRVTVGRPSVTLARAIDPQGYTERAKRYEELWREFLAVLKAKLDSRGGDRQVAINIR